MGWSVSSTFITLIFLYGLFAVFRDSKAYFKAKFGKSSRPAIKGQINIEARLPAPDREFPTHCAETVTRIKQVLQSAIGTGEILTIFYVGGSQPGSTRQIAPQIINGPICKAHCYSTNEDLSFRIDKLTIVPSETPVTYINDDR